MSAFAELDSFDDFEYIPKHPERRFGLIPAERTDEFNLDQRLNDVFDEIEQLGVIDDIPWGKYGYVIKNDEENDNRIVSVLRYERTFSKLRTLSTTSVEAFCILKCSDGVLRGEKHKAKHIRLSYGSRTAEDIESVMPLDLADIETMLLVALKAKSRKSSARFVIDANIA